MLVINHIAGPLPPAALMGKKRDCLRLTSEERRWGRRRLMTEGGREVALALPTGVVLDPGAILAVEKDWYLQVEAAEESVLAVRPNNFAAAIRFAFEVGNHHFPIALEDDVLLVPDDTAMVQLLSRLGESWERQRAVFAPIGRSHRHDH